LKTATQTIVNITMEASPESQRTGDVVDLAAGSMEWWCDENNVLQDGPYCACWTKPVKLYQLFIPASIPRTFF